MKKEASMKQWRPDAFQRLKNQVETIVQESGRPEGFDAEKWLNSWLNKPIGALGGKQPAEYIGTDEGVEIISNLLRQIQYGTYV
jgi:hypothetical protein